MARAALTLALAACLAACASAALPEKFNNTGGPPFLQGPMTVSNLTDFTQVSWIGWWDGNNYRLLSGAGNGQFTTADGTYQSWQCNPVDGSYTALVSVATTAADGTKTTKTVCERGLSLGSVMEWSQSETECPIMGDLSLTSLTATDVVNPCVPEPTDVLPPPEVLPGAPVPAPSA
ncbi:hypothetical protein COHA_009230 [Chlorella ohadii]|uniref:Uncharacterized protein n=1 Tax=Chlorella ohadii TaxID=2649997 RepID=A0AAD5H0T1_9CHLO|nr:hypothetical protein COHA_009230 [Chlorella ohadii]